MSVLIFYTSQLFHEINNIKNNLNSQNYELESKDELLDVLQSREMLTINLKGQKIDPEGYGKVIWSPYTKKALLQIANLPATNKDFNYRIWLVNNNNYFLLKADNKGSIDVTNQNSENLFKINNLPIDNINKNYSFIITLEEQGSAYNKPEGPIYLMGVF
jgi:rRNA pseudouridine-1189 N-methylase Emg1 (Nep1/Mra1 family)